MVICNGLPSQLLFYFHFFSLRKWDLKNAEYVPEFLKTLSAILIQFSACLNRWVNGTPGWIHTPQTSLSNSWK